MDDYKIIRLEPGLESLDVFNYDYAALRNIITCYKVQTEYCVSVFHDFGEKEPITVLFKDDKRYNSSGGVYIQERREIYVIDASAYMHEYIHYLTMNDSDTPLWIYEAIAFYYGYNSVDEKVGLSRYGEMRIMLEKNPYNSQGKVYYDIFKLAEDKLGHELDFFNDMEYDFYNNVSVVKSEEIDTLTSAAKGATAKISFYTYLVNTYDETSVMDAVRENKPITHLGKPWTELQADWEAYIRAEYAWVIN